MDEVRSIEHRIEGTERRVGQRIRERRIALGLTQQQLAKKAGITYPQMQKYERRENRVPAGMLPFLALALGVKVGYFFEEADTIASPSALSPAKEQTLSALLRNFNDIPSHLQIPFANVARALAA